MVINVLLDGNGYLLIGREMELIPENIVERGREYFRKR